MQCIPVRFTVRRIVAVVLGLGLVFAVVCFQAGSLTTRLIDFNAETMMSTFRPRLMEAETASDRMDALCEFIEYWLGPGQPGFGESEEAVDARPLPLPLKKLYRFAGRWPDRDHPGEIEYSVPAFSHQDWLASLSNVEAQADGRLRFLGENQNCWECLTLAQGDDPPVWCSGDLIGEEGDFRGEKLVSDSLSRFLATFILQELALGSKICLHDEVLRSRFEVERLSVVPIWLDHPYVYGTPCNFYLWGDVLAATLLDDLNFAANRESGIAFLHQNQAPVTSISLMLYRPWNLAINSDGSARVEYILARTYIKAEAPSGTFDFTDLFARIDSTASDQGNYQRDVVVSFHRQGQKSGVRGRYLPDSRLPLSLYRQALARAVEPNPEFQDLFESDWPV